MSKASEILSRINEGELSPADYTAFDKALEGLSAVCDSEDKWEKVAKAFSKLDDPISKYIDNALADGGKSNRNKLKDALEAGKRSQGTEPMAALDLATTIVKDATKTLSK